MEVQPIPLKRCLATNNLVHKSVRGNWSDNTSRASVYAERGLRFCGCETPRSSRKEALRGNTTKPNVGALSMSNRPHERSTYSIRSPTSRWYRVVPRNSRPAPQSATSLTATVGEHRKTSHQLRRTTKASDPQTRTIALTNPRTRVPAGVRPRGATSLPKRIAPSATSAANSARVKITSNPLALTRWPAR